MGCSASVTLVRTASTSLTTSPKKPGTTKGEPSKVFQVPNEQKKIIRKTWRYLNNDLTGRGTKVFLTIFQLYPQVKQLFPFKDVHGQELVKDAMFKGHASRFMQAVGAVVDNLDDLQVTILPLLTNLGRRHVLFQDFQGAFFDAFEQGMLVVWSEELGTRFDERVRDAWTHVLGFIIGTLKAGYDEEKALLLNAAKKARNCHKDLSCKAPGSPGTSCSGNEIDSALKMTEELGESP